VLSVQAEFFCDESRLWPIRPIPKAVPHGLVGPGDVSSGNVVRRAASNVCRVHAGGDSPALIILNLNLMVSVNCFLQFEVSSEIPSRFRQDPLWLKRRKSGVPNSI